MKRQGIPFEIHITVADLPELRISSFVDFCHQQGAKPLLIELARGEYTQQPMLSKVVYPESVASAVTTATKYAQLLKEFTFPVSRIKIEIPASYSKVLEGQSVHKAENYFEWHGKISLVQERELMDICLKHQVHLSRNALKGETSTRFVTLREYGTKTVFEERIRALMDDLGKGGWEILKKQAEYCVFDTNTSLDKGWLQ